MKLYRKPFWGENASKGAVLLRLNAAAFIKFFVFRVRRLFEGDVYTWEAFILNPNDSMVTDHFNFKQKPVLVLVLKEILLYCSQFHNLHVNTTAIHQVNRDL